MNVIEELDGLRAACKKALKLADRYQLFEENRKTQEKFQEIAALLAPVSYRLGRIITGLKNKKQHP